MSRDTRITEWAKALLDVALDSGLDGSDPVISRARAVIKRAEGRS